MAGFLRSNENNVREKAKELKLTDERIAAGYTLTLRLRLAKIRLGGPAPTTAPVSPPSLRPHLIGRVPPKKQAPPLGM